MEALSSKLLITLQQLRMQTSLSLGALYILIFCNSFCASYINKRKLVTVRLQERVLYTLNQIETNETILMYLDLKFIKKLYKNYLYIQSQRSIISNLRNSTLARVSDKLFKIPQKKRVPFALY